MPQKPPGAQRDLGLDDVVARAQRVLLGVEEGEDALALVVVEIGPGDGQRRRTQGTHQQELPDPHAGHEQEADTAGAQHDRGAEIGLDQDQGNGGADHQQRRDQEERPLHLLEPDGVEVAGQRQDQRHLHELGGLDLDEAEIEPALGALVDLAQDVHRHQQRDGEGVERVGDAVPETLVDHRHGDHQRDAQRQPEPMPPSPGLVAAAAGGIEHAIADEADHQHQGDEGPVQVAELLAQGQLRGAQTDGRHQASRASGASRAVGASPAGG